MKYKNNLFQYDQNQTITNVDGLFVDYILNDETLRVPVVDGNAIIPNEVLAVAGMHYAYVCLANETRLEFRFKVTARVAPPDVPYAPSHAITFDDLVKTVQDEVKSLEERAASGEFDGKDGKDYVITPADYDAIAERVTLEGVVKTVNHVAPDAEGNVDVQGGGETTDVQLNGVSITKDGVANIPVAGETLGVVKVQSNGVYGIESIAGGHVAIKTPTTKEITDRAPYKAVTLEVLDDAVSTSLNKPKKSSGSIDTWASARKNMKAQTEFTAGTNLEWVEEQTTLGKKYTLNAAGYDDTEIKGQIEALDGSVVKTVNGVAPVDGNVDVQGGGSSVTMADNAQGGVDLTVDGSTKTLAKEGELATIKADLSQLVSTKPQTLTEAQKAQARANIGVGASGTVDEVARQEISELSEAITDIGHTKIDAEFDNSFYVYVNGTKSTWQEIGHYDLRLKAHETIKAYVKGSQTNVAFISTRLSEEETKYTVKIVCKDSEPVWVKYTAEVDCIVTVSSYNIASFRPIIYTYMSPYSLVDAMNDTTKYVDDSVLEVRKDLVEKKSINIFDKNNSDVVIGKYILDNGSIADGGSYFYSHKIPCKYGDVIHSSMIGVSYYGGGVYDSDDKFLGRIAISGSAQEKSFSYTVNKPTASYVRYNGYVSRINESMLSVNVELPSEYEPYYKYKVLSEDYRLNSTEVSEVQSMIDKHLGTFADYKGKDFCTFSKVLCIGDSLTVGTFNANDSGTEEYIEIPKYSYPTIMSKMYGIETENWGLGGRTTKSWYEEKQNVSWSGFDCAIIILGANDQKLTNIADSKIYLQYIVNKLKSDNNGIKIFIGTLLPNYYENLGTVGVAVNRRAVEICEENTNCYLVDLTTYSACKNGTEYVQGHLTALGYRKEAEELMALCSYVMHDNINDFKYIHFINSTHSWS